MNALPSYLPVATFGTSASVVQPDGTTYANGYLPGAVLPAQHENWFMNRMTSNENTLMTQVASIQAELNNLLANYSVTPDGTVVQIKNLLASYLNTVTLTSAASPYTLTTPTSGSIFLIGQGASPFVFNLPTTASYLGKRLTICANGNTDVKIVPSSGESIGKLPVNTAIYVSYASGRKSCDLIAESSGIWGISYPGYTVDTVADGANQKYLGALVLFNYSATGRGFSSFLPPATGAYYGSSFTPAGSIAGVPTGSVAVRIKVDSTIVALAAGDVRLSLYFSATGTGGATASDPGFVFQNKAVTAGDSFKTTYESDVFLGASGQFYAFSSDRTNLNTGSSSTTITVMGYYPGN